MATKGQTLTNALGERYYFWETASSTNGNLCKFEFWLPPQMPESPPHYHPHQDEVIHVIHGELSVQTEGKHRIVRDGETVFIPKGTTHNICNRSGTECHATCEVTPVLEWEYFLEDFSNLAATGEPSLLQLAVMIQSHKTTVAAPAPMKYVLAFMGWLGKAIGTKVPRSARTISS